LNHIDCRSLFSNGFAGESDIVRIGDTKAMSPRSPLNELFPSEEAKYLFYNVHLPEHREHIYDFLTDANPQAPKIAILEGNRGIGREYFLRAALFDARHRNPGHDFVLLNIDLDGYEEGPDSLLKYLEHYSSKHATAPRPEFITGVSELQESKHKPNILDAFKITVFSGLSISFSLKVLKEWFTWDDEPKGDVKTPVRRDRERFHKFINWLCKDRQVVLHFTDASQLIYPLDLWLKYELKSNANLRVVFSTTPEDPLQTLTEGLPSLRLSFEPYDPQGIATAMSGSFSPNVFPDALYDALYRYSFGLPKEIALKVKDLLEADLIYEDKKGLWRISGDGFDEQAWAEAFSVSFISPFEDVLEGLPADDRTVLSRFFCLMAMCGTAAPVALILEFLGIVEEEERDCLLEMVDERLVESTPPWLIDYAYTHPSFEGILTYGYADPICAQIILSLFSDYDRETLALKFGVFLRKKMGLYTKGAARVHLELARHAKDLDQYEEYGRLLSWWTEEEYSEDLKDILIQGMKDGSPNPAVLWDVFLKTEVTWPPQRRLMLLDVYAAQRDGIPVSNLREFHYQRGWVLFHMGHYSEALDDAELAVEMSSQKHDNILVRYLNLRGLCKEPLGLFNAAINDFELALSIAKQLFGAEHPDALKILTSLADLLDKTGHADETRTLRQQYVHIQSSKADITPPALQELAFEYFQLGYYAQAEEILNRLLQQGFDVLDIYHDLARLSLVTDRITEARKYVTQAWERRSEARPYLIARLLWFQLAITLLEGAGSQCNTQDVEHLLGLLKTTLQNAAAFAEWVMEPVLNHLKPQIPDDAHALLTALVAAINSRTHLDKLSHFPVWREAEPLPLE
jgi:tetratricopeptide (TPR) repeat protein